MTEIKASYQKERAKTFENVPKHKIITHFTLRLPPKTNYHNSLSRMAVSWDVPVHPCTGTEALYRPYGP
jgi:hypothetical protein